ncbi:MAG: aminotransferase class V-fold PLP-dependent enzyme [Candidatus Norongarragalinales archaeon]
MRLFDPRKADLKTLENPDEPGEPPSVFGSLKRRGGVSWKEKIPGWWAGVTIAAPRVEAALEAEKAKKLVLELVKRIKRGDERAVQELNDAYFQTAESFRDSVKSVLGNREVLFETNATTALMLIRALSGVKRGQIVTTEDLPQTLYWTMRGGDPHLTQKPRPLPKRDLLLPPNLGFFSSHPEVRPGGERIKIGLKKIPLYDGSTPTGQTEFLENLESAVSNPETRMVVIPHVTRTGQILPVTQARRIIDKENSGRKQERKILFVVDAAQSIGRVPLEEIRKAHEASDFFFFTTAKALGNVLGNAVVTARRKLVGQGISHFLNSPFSKYAKYYQFPTKYERVYDFLDSRDFHTAVSLPELKGGLVAFNARYAGPQEKLEREDERIIEETKRNREKVVQALEKIPLIEVIKPREDAPFAPSVISFKLRNTEAKAEDLKPALQGHDLGYGLITVGALVDNGVLRLEIPTYRQMPSVEKLVGKIRLLLGLPEKNY